MVPYQLDFLSHLPDHLILSWCYESAVRSNWLICSCSWCAPSDPTPAHSCRSISALLSLMGLSTNLYNYHHLYEENNPTIPSFSILLCSFCQCSVSTHLASQPLNECRYLAFILQDSTNPSTMEPLPLHLLFPIHKPFTLHLLMPLGLL